MSRSLLAHSCLIAAINTDKQTDSTDITYRERDLAVAEKRYRFVDKSGHCFSDLGLIEDSLDYWKEVARRLKSGETYSIGEAMIRRDELFGLRFKWGTDFYFEKVKDDNG